LAAFLAAGFFAAGLQAEQHAHGIKYKLQMPNYKLQITNECKTI